MSAYKALENVCIHFEEYLRKSAVDLAAVRVGDTFEENVAKKLKDLALYTSKLRLLRAKPTSLTPEVTTQQKTEESTISNYKDTVQQKIIEQQIVKSLCQSHAVRKLLTTDNAELEPDLLERKEKILSQLEVYEQKEMQLRLLDAQLKEKQSEYDAVRERWDVLVGELKEIREKVNDVEDQENSDPVERKLQNIVQRMEMFRFLISKFITCRTTKYDWMTDPDNLIQMLKITRQQNTVSMFTE